MNKFEQVSSDYYRMSLIGDIGGMPMSDFWVGVTKVGTVKVPVSDACWGGGGVVL